MYVKGGLQTQDYPNNKNVEPQVIQSLAKSTHEVAGSDNASIISQLITTSQEAEANVNAFDNVIVMENFDNISTADEINHENRTENSGITDINSILYFSQPIVEMQTVEIENVSVVYQETLKERKDSSLETLSENVVNRLNESNDIMIEKIKKPYFVSDLGKENDSKNHNLSIEELNAYDIEEKIRLSTFNDLNEESDGKLTSSDKSETLTNVSVERFPFGRGGRPKKSEVKSLLQKVTDDKGSDENDSKEVPWINGSKVPSMQKFKSMVEIWAQKNKEKPVLPSSVLFGTRKVPVEKPNDLDDDFFSASNKSYFCSNCSLLFREKSSFIRHRFNTDGKCYYECDVCFKKYIERGEFSGHRNNHLYQNNKPHLCTICNQGFARKYALNLHIQQHHQDRSNYSCFICGKLFKVRPSLLNHLKLAHIKEEERMALCSQCPKRFKSFNELKIHEKVHTVREKQEKTVPCDVCSKLFTSVKNLRTHRYTHSQERNYVCEICGKGFFTRTQLKSHMFVHTGAKPFACTICTYRCNRNSNLVKHMKIHAKLPSENSNYKNQRKGKSKLPIENSNNKNERKGKSRQRKSKELNLIDN